MNKQFLIFCASVMLIMPALSPAQSTYGSILGTVKDPSGGFVPDAAIHVVNLDKNTARDITSNSSGDYELSNILPGHYSVTVVAKGFETFTTTDLQLVARQILRVDAQLQIGQTSELVLVQSADTGIIQTDTQVIQETFTPQQLLNLPANIRANGNTSSYQLIQVLPGVQSDSSNNGNGNLSIQGGIQSQAQYSVDGISITNVTGNSPLINAFPSTESIAETKVQGVGSPAEYGQVGDVTVVSKSGSNSFHGALFWYTQNSALNALNFGDTTKPKLIANDYGATVGGPVLIPHLYHGKDKTFFYGTYEGFRYPRASVVQNIVPSQDQRNGVFTSPVVDPATNLPFANNTIPTSRISPITQKLLTLFPTPNASLNGENFIENRDTSYHSEQYDLRIDQYLSSKHSLFGRFTFKDINTASTNNLLLPSNNNPDNYRLLVLADNYSFSANLLNEARFGFTFNDSGYSNSFNGAAFSNSLGLQGLPGLPAFFNGVPAVDITGYTGLTAGRLEGISHSRSMQFLDNLTWTKGKHTFRFGFDYQHIEAVSPLGFIGGDNYGNFAFTGQFSGNALADFLLGLPSSSAYDNVQQDNDGITNHYNAYIQDTFKVTPKLTLEMGLRFEFHPGYTDASGNIGNFDPKYPGSGAVVYPDGKSSLLAAGFLQSANACLPYGSTTGPSLNGVPCMPVLSASQAGLPQSLRTAPRRFMPRFGFAWRPVGDRTVFRGGFSVYNTEVLGSIYYALTGTLQSATYTFNNSITNGTPSFQWPNVGVGDGISVAAAGTDYFGTANQIDYKDPYSEQWNFSIDRDLGFKTGLRLSYVGMETHNLVYAPNLNQSWYSNTYYVNQPLTSRPFPNWGVINTRANGANASYNAGEIELNHRTSAGITLTSSYTYAKNLADNAGYSNQSFADENAGARTMDAYNLKHEYGPVSSSRRHRWITSAVYDLPVGRTRKFGSHMNPVLDAVVGGWQLSSIFLWQSGPYLTPYFSGGDPSGTGSGVIGRAQAPDVNSNPNSSDATAAHWFNAGAFSCPGVSNWVVGTACLIGTPGNGAPIGRFGNAGVGIVNGPGTVNLNAGLAKYFAVTERVKIRVEGSFTNVLNHLNLGDPVLSIDQANVGAITSARPSDFGGSRSGQVGARIEF